MTCPACESPLSDGSSVCPECGYDAAKARPEPFAPGTVLEQRYRIESEVGRGGMGVVYRGVDLTLQRPVAIKALTGAFADAETINQFMQEARSLASIEHPGVVPVYAVGRHGGCYFMVMKFIEGQPLSDVLRERGALPVEDVRSLLDQTLEALIALHGRGLVHRDLKPGNLMMGSDGRVTVMDLGISKKLGDVDAASATSALGTPRYMPPEMISDEAEDGRADLYSLGVIAWHALVGRVPFDGPTPMAILYKQGHEQAEPLRKVVPHVPRDLADVVERVLQKRPADRFAGATEMAQALAGGGEAGGLGRRLGALVLAVSLVAGGLTAGWWLNRGATLETVDAGAASADTPDAAVADAAVAQDAARPVDAAPPPVDAAPPPKDAARAKPVVPTVTVNITSRPSGASVYYRGRRLGRTPLTLERPRTRAAVVVTLERSGHEKTRLRLDLSRDGKAHARLKPLFDLVP